MDNDVVFVRETKSVQIFVKIEGFHIVTLDVDVDHEVPNAVLRKLSNKMMFTYPTLSNEINCSSCYQLVFSGNNITFLDNQILASLGIAKESTLHAVRVFGRCPTHGKPYKFRPCASDYKRELHTYRENHSVSLVKAHKETHSTIVDDMQWLQTMAAGANSVFMKDDMHGAYFFVPNKDCYSEHQTDVHHHDVL